MQQARIIIWNGKKAVASDRPEHDTQLWGFFCSVGFYTTQGEGGLVRIMNVV
jgi:hypothetical protein